MKLSIWDILTGIIILAILLVGGLVMSVFANPYTAINPFPPQKLPPTVVIPSSTATYPAMPATWTPNAETQQAYLALGYTLVPSDTPGPSPTGFTLTPTDTPTETETPTDTPTPTSPATQYVYVAPTTAATSCSGCTDTPVPDTATPTSMPNIGSVKGPKGVTSNVWQHQTSNPVFLMPIPAKMYAFAWYWGLDPNGGEDTSGGTSIPTNYQTVQHDSATSIDFTPPAVTACGAYYLRIMAYWAVKSGSSVTTSTSGWSTVFIFKYDATAPIPVFYVPTGIKGALRGIQNISGDPNFNWAYWNGNSSGSILPSGDYRYYGANDDGVDPTQIYQCSGIKGYYVYWGTDPNGIDKSHFTTSASYNPSKKNPNTAYYLRLQSVDNQGNTSQWWTVALDDTYVAPFDPDTVVAAGGEYVPVLDPNDQPTNPEAAFYYDKVPPTNITSITEHHYGTPDNAPFNNNNAPQFTFSGGNDPNGFPGFNTAPWGYDVIWSTTLNDSVSKFQTSSEFDPLVSKSGTYYLKVRDVDWAGNRPTGWQTYTYKFDNVGPLGVTKVTVTGGVPNNAWTRTADDPSFSWSGSQVQDPGSTTTSSGMDTPINYDVYFGIVNPPGGYTYTSQTSTTFDPGSQTTGVYVLRIRVVDKAGNETITTPFTMKFDNTAPDAPTIKETDYKNISNHPTFRWESLNEVGSGIASYYYYYGTNPPSGTPGNFSNTTYLDGKVHGSGLTYHLWVVAKDVAGNISDPATFDFVYP